MQYFQGYANTIVYNILLCTCMMCDLSVLHDIIFVFTTLLNLYDRFASSNTHKFITTILTSESSLSCTLRLYNYHQVY